MRGAKDTVSLKSSLSATNNIRIAKCDSVSRAHSSTNTASTVLPSGGTSTISQSISQSQSQHVAQLYDQITTKRSNFYNTLPHVPPRENTSKNNNTSINNNVQRRNTLANINLKHNPSLNKPISVIQSEVYDELPGRTFEIPEKNITKTPPKLMPSENQVSKIENNNNEGPSDYIAFYTPSVVSDFPGNVLPGTDKRATARDRYYTYKAEDRDNNRPMTPPKLNITPDIVQPPAPVHEEYHPNKSLARDGVTNQSFRSMFSEFTNLTPMF